MTTSERLVLALEKSPFSSIHAFKQVLNDRFPRVKGRSYSAIHGYFRGVGPPLEFLEAAAEVLDVPVQWLRTGEGSMEHQHTEREHLNVGRLFEDCTASEGLQWLRQHAGDLMISSWWNATRSIVRSCPDADSASWDDLRVIGWWVLCTAVEPFRKTGLSGRSEKRRSLTGTLNLFFQGLAQAAPEPREGKALADLVAGLLDSGPRDTSKED